MSAARTRHETARTDPGMTWQKFWAHLGQSVGTVLLVAYALACRDQRDARRSLRRAVMLRRLSGGVG